MKASTFPWKIICWTTVFAIAMGFLETSVVVYIRALLYPGGFNFPLAPIPQSIAITELLREAATLVMLIGIGFLSGRNGISRFAYFLYAFAIWDIFYYVFLKLLLNWPESLLTWDILFMIPVTWVRPVIAPIVVSITMVVLSWMIIRFDSKEIKTSINLKELTLLIVGSMVMVLSFTWDYSGYMLEHYRFSDIWSIPTQDMLYLATKYIPRRFNWFLFAFAEMIICSGIGLFYLRLSKSKNKS